MAATTNIERTIGAAGSPTAINATASGIGLSLNDANNGATPVVRPQAGGLVQASFAASLVLRVSSGTGSAISNKRLYYTGTLPSGFGLFHNVPASTPAPSAAYQRGGAVVCTGTTIGGAAIANVTVNGVATAASGFVALTSNPAGTLFDSASDTVANLANGLGSDYVFLIGALDSTASLTGAVPLATIHLVYDEQ